MAAGAPPAPHAIVFPFPGAMGHIGPMLELARRLRQRAGCRVTVVYTQHDLSRLQGRSEELAEDIAVETIADRVPLDVPPAERGAFWLLNLQLVEEDWAASFDALLAKLLLNGTPISCIISDYFLPFTQDVADKYAIPRVLFWPQSASVLAIYCSEPLLDRNRLSHGPAAFVARGCESAAAQLLASSIPGLPPLRGVDLPYFWVLPDGSDLLARWAVRVVHASNQRLSQAACVLCNTAYGLETQTLDHLQHRLLQLPVVPVGPLVPSPLPPIDGAGGQDLEIADVEHMRPSFWSTGAEHRKSTVAWLDSRAPNSVVYVSLGSVVTPSPAHIHELALGLQASEQAFLWVIRGYADATALAQMLPPGFVGDTEAQGLIVPWAPQLQVLSHSAVGGFLTHAGWNSTLEAITMGVPMIVWPWLLDQKTNSRMVVAKLRVGIELAAAPTTDFMVEAAPPLNPETGRLQVEKSVRALMQEEYGREMRGRIATLSRVARSRSLEQGCKWLDDLMLKRTNSRTKLPS